ncbi:unnamed protein product [Camellia sinensis]
MLLGDCHNVWVMKEYGAGDSRTKFTINYGDFCLWKPLCLPRTGKVLLDVRQKKLVIFDPEEKKCLSKHELKHVKPRLNQIFQWQSDVGWMSHPIPRALVLPPSYGTENVLVR